MSHRGRAELIAQLNDDLAREYAAAIENRTCASLVWGPHRPTLRRLFTAQVATELAHASLLADKIATLGGRPGVHVAPVAPFDRGVEPEAMLRRLFDLKVDAIARYRARRALAAEVGEHGLAVDLDDLVGDETRHRDELAQLLRGSGPTPDWRAPAEGRDGGLSPTLARSGRDAPSRALAGAAMP